MTPEFVVGFGKEVVWVVSRQYLEQTGYDPNYLKGDIFLIANALEKDSFHKSHTHFDCVLSGVWYLQVPENSAPLEFEDPVFARQLRHIPVIDNDNRDIHDIEDFLKFITIAYRERFTLAYPLSCLREPISLVRPHHVRGFQLFSASITCFFSHLITSFLYIS